MDQIALISDIHGNMPALEAVFDDIRKRKIKRIFCLGDMVGKGPYPQKAINICRDKCEKVIMGNWEFVMSANPSPKIISWQKQQLDVEQLEYIGGLPGCIDIKFSGKNLRLLHASHTGVMKRIQRTAPDNEQIEIFNNTGFTGHSFVPDIVGYADIHIVFLKHFREKILFNIGSVGNPLDFPQASYAILEGDYNSNINNVFSISITRVPYDIEQSIRQAVEEGIPDLERYANELRTAEYGGDPALHQ